MGSVSAAENLETYNELNFPSTNQKYQTELKRTEISRILNHLIEECTDLLSDSCKILNNEQIDNGITLKSKSIMQRNSLFPK